MIISTSTFLNKPGAKEYKFAFRISWTTVWFLLGARMSKVSSWIQLTVAARRRTSNFPKTTSTRSSTDGRSTHWKKYVRCLMVITRSTTLTQSMCSSWTSEYSPTKSMWIWVPIRGTFSSRSKGWIKYWSRLEAWSKRKSLRRSLTWKSTERRSWSSWRKKFYCRIRVNKCKKSKSRWMLNNLQKTRNLIRRRSNNLLIQTWGDKCSVRILANLYKGESWKATTWLTIGL